MPKLKVKNIFLDGTAEEKKKKIDQNHILWAKRGQLKDYSPTFEPGKSIIVTKRGFSNPLPHRENEVILIDGEQRCWNLNIQEELAKDAKGKPITIKRGYWTNVFGGLKETTDFVTKVEKKSQASRKPTKGLDITTIGIFALIGISVACLIFEIFIARGMKII